jgi:hypothetical protein
MRLPRELREVASLRGAGDRLGSPCGFFEELAEDRVE